MIGTATVNKVGRILEADKAFLKISGLREDEAKWHYVVDMLKSVECWNSVRDEEEPITMNIRRHRGRDCRHTVSCSRLDENRWHVTISKV